MNVILRSNCPPSSASAARRPTSVVEVAGIEPASESLQRTEPTCLSDSFDLAKIPCEPARAASPPAFYDLGTDPKAEACTQPAVGRPGPVPQAEPAGRGRLRRPVLTVCQQLCLVPRFGESRSTRHASVAS
jgi:hypothetical protein